MILTVTGRHLELSPSVRQQIQKKIERLQRLLHDSAVSAQCVVAQERKQFVCELTLHARGDHMLVGVGKHARLLAAVGGAIEKVSQQAQRLADKWKTRRRTAQGVVRTVIDEPAPKPKAAPTKVVRARRYAVKSMSVGDAAAALGTAAFLVFRHADSGQVAVAFRRPDGQVGLIEPEA
jgi:putative sigma-54 modulation protein